LNRAIALVEPQMENLFHAPFNAALLHAIVVAYPAVRISFQATSGHAEAVKGILVKRAPAILETVEWRSLKVSSGGHLKRWQAHAKLLKYILRQRERVLFCSISRMQLFQLQRTMRSSDDVRAVLHGDIDRLASDGAEPFPTSMFKMDRVLLKRWPKAFRFVLLSQSIRQNIPAQFDQTMRTAAIIDHPYHFAAIERKELNHPVTFGIFGNSGDGLLLEAVARQIKAEHPHIALRMVGFVEDLAAVERLRPFVDCVGSTPVTPEVFAERARSVTYALWIASPDAFRLRASGTFFDALAYGKPLVYTANEFIDHYHAMAPEIGVRCETLPEIAAAMLKLADQHEAGLYEQRLQAIEAFRERFSPQSLAERLPEALGWET
jgi:hypothetical protein